MTGITFTSLYEPFTLKRKRKTIAWIQTIISSYHRFPGEIAFIFCSDTYLLKMNKTYLKHTTLTDIITFNYNQGFRISGDIFISVERVRENAEKFDTTFDDELYRVMIHGILHLLGFNDKTPAQKKRMTLEEQNSLRVLYL